MQFDIAGLVGQLLKPTKGASWYSFLMFSWFVGGFWTNNKGDWIVVNMENSIIRSYELIPDDVRSKYFFF